jgi:hypothetical protein
LFSSLNISQPGRVKQAADANVRPNMNCAAQVVDSERGGISQDHWLDLQSKQPGTIRLDDRPGRQREKDDRLRNE